MIDTDDPKDDSNSYDPSFGTASTRYDDPYSYSALPIPAAVPVTPDTSQHRQPSVTMTVTPATTDQGRAGLNYAYSS